MLGKWDVVWLLTEAFRNRASAPSLPGPASDKHQVIVGQPFWRAISLPQELQEKSFNRILAVCKHNC